MPPPPLSVQLYSLREETKDGRHLAVLKKLAAAGYVGVEAAGYYGMQPADYRKAVTDLGMQVSGSHIGLPKPEEYQQVIDAMHALGTAYAIVPWTPREDWSSPDRIKALAEKLEHARVGLGKGGISLAYHNHDQEIVRHGGRTGLEIVLGLVPGLKLEIDTYWAANFGAEKPAEIVKTLRAATPMLHLKDGTFQPGAKMLACGKGKQDFAAIIAAADPKLLQWVVVELDECATDMWTAIDESAKFLISKQLVSGGKKR